MPSHLTKRSVIYDMQAHMRSLTNTMMSQYWHHSGSLQNTHTFLAPTAALFLDPSVCPSIETTSRQRWVLSGCRSGSFRSYQTHKLSLGKHALQNYYLHYTQACPNKPCMWHPPHRSDRNTKWHQTEGSVLGNILLERLGKTWEDFSSEMHKKKNITVMMQML